MRIKIRAEKRMSIAYQLSPNELTIAVPDNMSTSMVRTLESASPGSTLHIENPSAVQVRQMLDSWSHKLHVKPKRVQVRKLSNKWASCSSSRTIVLNSKLAAMPEEFAEYVVCHELLHLKVARHNKLFKGLLSAYMPDWQERLTRTIQDILGCEIETMLVHPV
jgi:hypothetical protein